MSSDPRRGVPQVLRGTPVRDIDLLFMIDDSPSMSDKQFNLAANVPLFVDQLDHLPGGFPNLHIGVVTSDLGTLAADGTSGPALGTIGRGGCGGSGKAGVLQLASGVATTGGERFLIDVATADGARQRNYSGSLARTLGQMARVGAAGCAFEQPIEAVKRALDPATVENAGFLRPDAALAVVFLTDEDDCSMAHSTLLGSDPALGPLQSFRCTRFGVLCSHGGATSDDMNQVGGKAGCHPDDDSPYLGRISAYADELKRLKQDPADVVVAAIAGPTDPFNVELRSPAVDTSAIPALAHSCAYNGADGLEVADPPIRLGALLDQFAGRSALSSICQSDFSGPLQQVGGLVSSISAPDPCLAGALLDVDPSTPGVQDDCMSHGVPRCELANGAPSNAPCWRLVTDASCTLGDHQKLQIEGASSAGRTTVTCSLEPGH